MANGDNGNGVVLKWAHIVILLGSQLVLIAASYAALKFQVEDHARRLDAIEKKQEANFIPRAEYDTRHNDLLEQIRELRNEVRELRKGR